MSRRRLNVAQKTIRVSFPMTVTAFFMNIAINCRSFLKKQNTGIGRYAFHLVQSLSQIDAQNQYYLYVEKGFFDRKRSVPKAPAQNFCIKRDFFSSGPERLLTNIDVYHSPHPEILTMSRARVVVTIHDLIYKVFPESHTPQTISLTEQCLRSVVERAERIICPSRQTLEDFKKYFSFDVSRLRVIYHGVERDIFYPLTEKERPEAKHYLRAKGIEGNFILFLGTIEPRKNLANLLRALALLKDRKKFSGKLVVIGMKGWGNEAFAKSLEVLQLSEEVIFLGFLQDRELRFFYNLADVFVFPSLYEGFGFPILEAMGCGAAVVTSNVSSCPEIAGGAALTVDPKNPQELASALERVIHDEALKSELKAKGLRRAEEFSFLKTARETLQVYQEVASIPSRT